MAIFAHEQLSGKGHGARVGAQKGCNIILSILIKPQPLLLTQQFMPAPVMAVAIYDFFIKYAGLIQE